MGQQKGFDLVRPLSLSQRKSYEAFIRQVRSTYHSNPDFYFGETGFFILHSDIPHMPYDGLQFRRFSAKIRGPLAGKAEEYTKELTKMFFKHFEKGDIEKWNELRQKVPSKGWAWGEKDDGAGYVDSVAGRERLEENHRASQAKYSIWMEKMADDPSLSRVYGRRDE